MDHGVSKDLDEAIRRFDEANKDGYFDKDKFMQKTSLFDVQQKMDKMMNDSNDMQQQVVIGKFKGSVADVKNEVIKADRDYDLARNPADVAIGLMLTEDYNSALNPNEEGRAKTVNNYIAYGYMVGISIELECTIRDVIRCKDYAELLSTCGGDIFEDGKYNPEIIVDSYGHLVQGINIGDKLDINHTPNVVNVRAIVNGAMDFQTVRNYFVARNTQTSFSLNADLKSKVVTKEARQLAFDMDNVNDYIKLKFKGVMEAGDIKGIYVNPDPFVINRKDINNIGVPISRKGKPSEFDIKNGFEQYPH